MFCFSSYIQLFWSDMCTHAQTAAFLLGVHMEPPNVDEEEASSMRLDRHFYGRVNEELFTAQWDNDQLKKDRDKLTTYVGQFYSESDCRLDILDAIKATMDVPKKFQHLGWCLSTACCMDPPHWLLTSLDIDSAFKAVRVEQNSGRNKKVVAIEVINTDLQEWARYLLKTGDPDKSCVTLPSTPHFDQVRKTHKEEQEESHMAPQPLKRSFVLYMNSDEESNNEEPPQHIKDVLTNVHSHYPAMNFPQYADKLKDRGILYLSTTAHFSIRFYEEKVGMPEGAAYTFQSCVSKTHMKAELAKGRRKAKGKKKARAQPDNENEENIRPTF
ncbi:hypothetical protein BD769DRAFT_1388671 [Suillus cothurnatus]|nr:hypothetical protein BD769DRAFT_1388671 [Suillus cothurnatus]